MKTMKIVEDKKFGCETVETGSFAKFAQTHKLADPIKVPIRIGGLTGAGDRNQCHTNALILAYRYGGSVLSGLAEEGLLDTFEVAIGHFEVAIGHSVWITPEGNAVCPTAHNWDRFGDFELIPCWEHNYDAVRAFFESKRVLKLPKNVMFNKDGECHALDNVSDSLRLESLLNSLRGKRRKFAIKKLVQNGVSCTKSKPLRRSLITNKNFHVQTHIDGFNETHNKRFYEKVLER
jgi:hypothetical protein